MLATGRVPPMRRDPFLGNAELADQRSAQFVKRPEQRRRPGRSLFVRAFDTDGNTRRDRCSRANCPIRRARLACHRQRAKGPAVWREHVMGRHAAVGVAHPFAVTIPGALGGVNEDAVRDRGKARGGRLIVRTAICERCQCVHARRGCRSAPFPQSPARREGRFPAVMRQTIASTRRTQKTP